MKVCKYGQLKEAEIGKIVSMLGLLIGHHHLQIGKVTAPGNRILVVSTNSIYQLKCHKPLDENSCFH